VPTTFVLAGMALQFNPVVALMLLRFIKFYCSVLFAMSNRWWVQSRVAAA
jgi:hypothetical protein